MSIEHSDLVALVAEVSATFVGFSLVVGLLQSNEPTAARRRESMRSVAELGLIAAGGAMLALALDSFGMVPDAVWRVASLLIAILWISFHMVASRRFKTAGSQITKTGILWIPASLAFVGMGILLWNAILPSGYSGPRYIASLILALTVSAFLFLLETFRDDGDASDA